MNIPSNVAAASLAAEKAGFPLSCDPDVGRLLSVLSAAVPPHGSVLELGTGAGVGTALGLTPAVGRDLMVDRRAPLRTRLRHTSGA